MEKGVEARGQDGLQRHIVGAKEHSGARAILQLASAQVLTNQCAWCCVILSLLQSAKNHVARSQKQGFCCDARSARFPIRSEIENVHCPKCKVAFVCIDDYHDHCQQVLLLDDMRRHVDTISCKLSSDKAHQLNVLPEVLM